MAQQLAKGYHVLVYDPAAAPKAAKKLTEEDRQRQDDTLEYEARKFEDGRKCRRGGSETAAAKIKKVLATNPEKQSSTGKKKRSHKAGADHIGGHT